MNSGTFVTKDETCRKSITSGSCIRGRNTEHNVFKEKSGPTSYAERNIKNSYAISSWRLLIDEPMLRHIKNCTEVEAHRQLRKNEWSTTLDELGAFISILYARGIYGANNIELDSLWSVLWGPPFSMVLCRGFRYTETAAALVLNVVAVRHESSTRAVALYESVSHQTICRVLNKNRLHLFHFQQVQAFLIRQVVFSDRLWTVQQYELQLDFIVHVLNSYEELL
ncbi:uncharacterized protein TNCV_2108001 [Trichonephila clavipes]|nr:uncharacterized protein TNCV_2108001 [Trichonephila clavipes]